MINQSTIDRVVNATVIEDIVAEYTSLKKSGSKYVGKCPFHEDARATNFYVTPALGICKCFACGEGGDAISFLMKKEGFTYSEAVKKLAAKYNIEVDEKQETPEEVQANLKREAMYIINEKVNAWFQKQLSVTPEAKKYADTRWKAETLKFMGVGFAPNSWESLVTAAKEMQLNSDLLLELGLIQTSSKGNLIDSFRNRITIPILNKSGRIEGFTARHIGSEEAPKYINSKESMIYSKTTSLFGFGQAFREAIKENRMYIVEGAPDAMKLIQIKAYNSIAPLGTALTDSQLKTIAKATKRITFIPDADKAGINAVKKNGITAVKAGLTVTVKEIPTNENGEKQDPDSYLVNIEQLKAIEEKDFIIWLAEKSLYANIPVSEAKDIVTQISEMLATIDDKTSISMYVDKLATLPGGGKANLWRKAIEEAKDRSTGKAKKENKLDTDDLHRFGFWIEKNSYYGMGKEGAVQWSNFTMAPMFHIIDAINPRRLYKIKNASNIEHIVEMKQEELISLGKFKLKMEGLGNYIWEAGEPQLIKLKKFLYEKTETATEVTQLGWQKNGGFFAWGNGVYDEKFYPTDEYGIVRLESENVYIPANSKIYSAEKQLFQFEKRFVHLNLNNITMKDYTNKLIQVFGDNAKVAVCFLIATLFRDVIVSSTKSFPILNLFGPKGAGKSELGHSLMAFFIVKNTPPNLSNATIPALADAVAQCANAIVHLDEFKNNIDLTKREFLKGLWDGAGRSRMNMDRDKKREITSVDSGVVVSGQEMATVDIALFSRFVFLCFNQTEYSNDEKTRFEELKRIEGVGLSHLTLQILAYRSKFESSFLSAYKLCSDDLAERLKDEGIEDRIYRNWLILLASFKTLESSIDMPFTYKDLFDVIVNGVIQQNQECKTNNELGGFWDILNYMARTGYLYQNSDYKLITTTSLKIGEKEWEWKTPKILLAVNNTRIFKEYLKHGKSTGETIMDDRSLQQYLRISKPFMGQKRARFDIIINGIIIKEGNRKKTSSDWAMFFDYEMLRDQYGINLESSTEDEDEESFEDNRV